VCSSTESHGWLQAIAKEISLFFVWQEAASWKEAHTAAFAFIWGTAQCPSSGGVLHHSKNVCNGNDMLAVAPLAKPKFEACGTQFLAMAVTTILWSFPHSIEAHTMKNIHIMKNICIALSAAKMIS